MTDTTAIDTVRFMVEHGKVIHKPIVDAGELFYNITGTRDLVDLITGIVYSGMGIIISILIPDAKIPDSFKSAVIAEKWKRVVVGVIVTCVFMRLFGFSIADASTGGFIMFSFGTGFLNIHLTGVLINISVGAVSKVAALGKSDVPPPGKP